MRGRIDAGLLKCRYARMYGYDWKGDSCLRAVVQARLPVPDASDLDMWLVSQHFDFPAGAAVPRCVVSSCVMLCCMSLYTLL